MTDTTTRAEAQKAAGNAVIMAAKALNAAISEALDFGVRTDIGVIDCTPITSTHNQSIVSVSVYHTLAQQEEAKG